VPTFYAAFLASPIAPQKSEVKISRCISAGEALPEEIAKRWKERYGVEISDGLGTTEMLHIYLTNAPGATKYGTTGRAVPGYEIKLIGEDGEPVDIASDDVNEYLRAIAPDVTAKDFRTWAGTVLAYRALRALDPPESDHQATRNVVAAIRETADLLGNTPAVCRKAYVHPVVVEAYLDGRLRGALLQAVEEEGTSPMETTPQEEKAVVGLLRRQIRDDAARVSRVS
jgi:acyl-CoA synthetase (AMP-forming)/AMP-acid ligase II